DGVVLESNHDINMLKVGPYPWSLKQRVLSRRGHLSNDSVASFLASGFDGRARHVFLAHLSQSNNLPELASLSAQKALEERSTLLRCQTSLEPASANQISATCGYEPVLRENLQRFLAVSHQFSPGKICNRIENCEKPCHGQAPVGLRQPIPLPEDYSWNGSRTGPVPQGEIGARVGGQS